MFNPPPPAMSTAPTPAASPHNGAAAHPPQQPDASQQRCNLRFCDAEREQQYLLHIAEHELTFSRAVQTTALITAFFLLFSDHHLFEEATFLTFVPVLLLSAGWAVWMTLTFAARFRARLPHATALFSAAAAAVLCANQWVCGYHGELHPYQMLLFVPLVSPFVGGIPWRFAIFPCLLSAMLLLIPEWLYQPDGTLRALHSIYILLAAMSALFSGYVHERISRQHFLLSNLFLEQSRHDPLTGLPNRRELDALLPRLIRQAQREQAPLAFAIIDVDHFKKYNDRYGHAAGDSALSAVAHAIARQCAQQPNFVARYGGEEFVAVWFRPYADAQTLGEGLRRAVQAANIDHEHSEHNGKLTVSVGITCCVPTPQDDADNLLRSTDAALYQAKTSGRNRVCLSAHANAQDEAAETAPDIQPAAPVTYSAGFLAEAEITREDRARWNAQRGTLERPQLRSMIAITLLTHFVLICANFALPAAPASQLQAAAQAFFIIPLLCVGAEFTRYEWAQRRSRRLTPLFIFFYGMSLCLIAWRAFQQQVDMPYELLILTVFLNYTVGTQQWLTACLNSWLFTLVYLAIRFYYLPDEELMFALMPFLLINIWGIIIGLKQDRLRLDSFVKQEKLKTLALQDALTGLANRQGMENYLAGICSLAFSKPHVLTVAMIDVDHFKAYNDHYGHAAGDVVLAAVGKAIGQFAGRRPYDFCGRYGGEEFILCWCQCDSTHAAVSGERIRTAVEALNIPHEKSPHGRITVSIGIMQGALSSTEPMKSIRALIELADQMLYQAKVAGRNRVTFRADTDTPGTSAPDAAADCASAAGQNCTPAQPA